jgi:thiol-disulfide isomerase/thioredoxin
MKKQIERFLLMHLMALFLLPVIPVRVSAQTRDVLITVHLRGVYDIKISVLALSGGRTFKPVVEVPGVKNGETAKFTLAKEHLPGECVLRFDYRETETSTPYPSEKHVFIYEQDLELWVSPKYCNNHDSTWFQPGERENSTFHEFSMENAARKEKLGLLQNFLMNYDDTESKFYQQGIIEYEQRRQGYNQWLENRIKQDKDLFISNLYRFQYVPEIAMRGSEADRIQSLMDHYFDGMDFKDPMLIKTADINKWMDNFVNLYGQLSTTVALRDSLFPLAGKIAIEKARKGDPLVYGWMVDYFYRGYESNGISAGMKVLEPYLNDPKCLTTKRVEIERRLKGMETLVAGSKAPDISLTAPDSSHFQLSSFQVPGKYILLLFWAAGCSHCAETLDELYPWQQQTGTRDQVSIVAVSMDETEEEIGAWRQKIAALPGWQHLHSPGGVRSKVAEDYFILATPVMVLIDATTRDVVAVPGTVNELKKVVK